MTKAGLHDIPGAVEHGGHPVGRAVRCERAAVACALPSGPERSVAREGVRRLVAIKLVQVRFARLSGIDDRIVGKHLTRGADEAECADNIGRGGRRYCSAAPRRLQSRRLKSPFGRDRRFAFELKRSSLAADQQRRKTQQQELSHRLTSRTRGNYAPSRRSRKDSFVNQSSSTCSIRGTPTAHQTAPRAAIAAVR